MCIIRDIAFFSNFFEKFQIDEERKGEQSFKSLQGQQITMKFTLYIIILDGSSNRRSVYTVDDNTWTVSSLWLGQVIRDYDFNPRKRRSWWQREVEQFHFHKFPLINRSTSANRVFVATVRHYMFHIHDRVWSTRRVSTYSRYTGDKTRKTTISLFGSRIAHKYCNTMLSKYLFCPRRGFN